MSSGDGRAGRDGVGPALVDGDGRRPQEAGSFHLFVYGTLRPGGSAAHILRDCERVGTGAVEGTLYDLGEYPALMLYGTTRIRGEVIRCPFEKLAFLDTYERVAEGLFRRVGLTVGDWDCWTYVAGPSLSRQLTPDRRVPEGVWRPGRAV